MPRFVDPSQFTWQIRSRLSVIKYCALCRFRRGRKFSKMHRKSLRPRLRPTWFYYLLRDDALHISAFYGKMKRNLKTPAFRTNFHLCLFFIEMQYWKLFRRRTLLNLGWSVMICIKLRLNLMCIFIYQTKFNVYIYQQYSKYWGNSRERFLFSQIAEVSAIFASRAFD